MVVMTPPVMTPVPEVTDAARPIIGPDHPAAPVRVVIGVVVIRVVRRSNEEPPVKVMPVREPNASAVEYRAGTKRATIDTKAATGNSPGMNHAPATWEPAAMEGRAAAMEGRAAAVKGRATTVEAAHASTAAAMTTATTAAAAVTTAATATSATTDFGDQRAGCGFR